MVVDSLDDHPSSEEYVLCSDGSNKHFPMCQMNLSDPHGALKDALGHQKWVMLDEPVFLFVSAADINRLAALTTNVPLL